MSDLIERLRELPTSNNKLRDEAVDEIERLTAYNEEHQSVSMLQDMRIAKLEARLEAAPDIPALDMSTDEVLHWMNDWSKWSEQND